jgi:hypothetical protein
MIKKDFQGFPNYHNIQDYLLKYQKKWEDDYDKSISKNVIHLKNENDLNELFKREKNSNICVMFHAQCNYIYYFKSKND